MANGDTTVDSPWQSIATPDPGREYLALLSDLPLKKYGKGLTVMAYARVIRMQLANTPGLIGYSFRSGLLRHRFWTLSIWEGERSLRAFVVERPHTDAMKSLGPHMAQAEFTRWIIKGSAVPPEWDEALRHAAAK